MVVTAHYIDPCWRLRKLIIGFKHVTDHKGATISKVLLDCLADWGIQNIFCVTVDKCNGKFICIAKISGSVFTAV